MSDDLLTTVKAALNGYARHGFYSMNFQPHEALSALLARCEAAEGCDGNCSCVVMSRHEWQRAYSEERLKRDAAEAERDVARAEAAQLVKLFNVDTAELREQRYAALQQRDAARAEAERERIENTHLREAFVTMERAANQHEAEAARLREALERIKVSARGLWEGEAARAALACPAREGGETW